MATGSIYAGYPNMAAGGYGMTMPQQAMPCCEGYGEMAPPRRVSNARRFLQGATEGILMGSLGMLGGFRR
ncbi:unnamed protein product [Caenorhabditis bovis]|uniref:Uncharacterized protein n=1 Tax=Caenorhabditis bovis TaxID=2654633 RepID=A0A8S1EA08_9PELO|nr:unnamed protein product [Caenorhabditis bovis]